MIIIIFTSCDAVQFFLFDFLGKCQEKIIPVSKEVRIVLFSGDKSLPGLFEVAQELSNLEGEGLIGPKGTVCQMVDINNKENVKHAFHDAVVSVGGKTPDVVVVNPPAEDQALHSRDPDSLQRALLGFKHLVHSIRAILPEWIDYLQIDDETWYAGATPKIIPKESEVPESRHKKKISDIVQTAGTATTGETKPSILERQAFKEFPSPIVSLSKERFWPKVRSFAKDSNTVIINYPASLTSCGYSNCPSLLSAAAAATTAWVKALRDELEKENIPIRVQFALFPPASAARERKQQQHDLAYKEEAAVSDSNVSKKRIVGKIPAHRPRDKFQQKSKVKSAMHHLKEGVRSGDMDMDLENRNLKTEQSVPREGLLQVIEQDVKEVLRGEKEFGKALKESTEEALNRLPHVDSGVVEQLYRDTKRQISRASVLIETLYNRGFWTEFPGTKAVEKEALSTWKKLARAWEGFVEEGTGRIERSLEKGIKKGKEMREYRQYEDEQSGEGTDVEPIEASPEGVGALGLGMRWDRGERTRRKKAIGADITPIHESPYAFHVGAVGEGWSPGKKSEFELSTPEMERRMDLQSSESESVSETEGAPGVTTRQVRGRKVKMPMKPFERKRSLVKKPAQEKIAPSSSMKASQVTEEEKPLQPRVYSPSSISTPIPRKGMKRTRGVKDTITEGSIPKRTDRQTLAQSKSDRPLHSTSAEQASFVPPREYSPGAAMERFESLGQGLYRPEEEYEAVRKKIRKYLQNRRRGWSNISDWYVAPLVVGGPRIPLEEKLAGMDWKHTNKQVQIETQQVPMKSTPEIVPSPGRSIENVLQAQARGSAGHWTSPFTGETVGRISVLAPGSELQGKEAVAGKQKASSLLGPDQKDARSGDQETGIESTE